MNWSQNRLARPVALLLVGSAALFAAGTAIEHGQRGGRHQEHSESVTGESGEESHGDETQSEKIAGVDPESWPLVGLAIGLSLLLAAGVYRWRGRWLLAAAGFALVFAAGDARELVHQIQESRTTIATIAAILITLHLLIAALASLQYRRE